MGSMALILIDNIFWGYDFFIFVIAGAAGLVYWRTWKSANELRDDLRLSFRRKGGGTDAEKITSYAGKDVWEVLLDRRERARFLYSCFEKLSSIFPMLGILGTVMSLLPMVRDIEDMQQNFFVALTSTFWGIVFAIICKGLDASLSARMDENYDEVDRYMNERHLAAPEDTP